MHILILTYVYPKSDRPSSGLFVQEQAKALTEKGLKIGIINIELLKITKLLNAPFYPSTTIDLNGEIPAYYKSGINILPKLPYYMEYAWKKWAEELFIDYIKTYGKPDVIHAHFGLWAGFAANYLSGKYGVPFILTEHSTYLAEEKFSSHEINLHAQIYKNATKIITVSEGLKKQVKKLVDRSDIEIISNVIDTTVFKPIDSVPEKYFFSLGNLIPQKGFDIVIRAFSEFSIIHNEYKLIIGGKGYLSNQLKKLAKDLKIEDQVVFVGELNQKQVIKYMQEAKAFVLASRFETFGVVFAEAIACGTPVIATRCGGPEEYVTTDNGIICEVENINEVGIAMEKIIEGIFQKEALHQYIVNVFSKPVIVNNLIRIYKETIASTN
jgi:L-malate glycosyltransferase